MHSQCVILTPFSWLFTPISCIVLQEYNELKYYLSVDFIINYFSQHRLPYGMTTVQPIPGVPGMAGVAMPAVPGMAPVQVAGVPRVPNGMSGVYSGEKPAGLYPGATPGYQGLAQPSYLTPTSLGQPGTAAFYGASSHPTYLPVTSPSTQQRYMVSAGYPGAGSLVSSPSLIPGELKGFSLMAKCSRLIT